MAYRSSGVHVDSCSQATRSSLSPFFFSSTSLAMTTRLSTARGSTAICSGQPAHWHRDCHVSRKLFASFHCQYDSRQCRPVHHHAASCCCCRLMWKYLFSVRDRLRCPVLCSSVGEVANQTAIYLLCLARSKTECYSLSWPIKNSRPVISCAGAWNTGWPFFLESSWNIFIIFQGPGKSLKTYSVPESFEM